MTAAVRVAVAKSYVRVGTTQHRVVVAQPQIRVVAVGVQGPAGPGSNAGYNHVQGPASNIWTINHNLGYRPSVELFTTGGVEFEAEVIHTTVNQCVVYLAVSIAGSARLV